MIRCRQSILALTAQFSMSDIWDLGKVCSQWVQCMLSPKEEAIALLLKYLQCYQAEGNVFCDRLWPAASYGVTTFKLCGSWKLAVEVHILFLP